MSNYLPFSDAQPAPFPLNMRGKLIDLGPLDSNLLPTYQRWINDFETIGNLDLDLTPTTREQELEWFNHVSQSEHDVDFTIYEKQTGKPLGNVGLHKIDFRDRKAEFGIFIGEIDYRGRGYGTEATRLVLSYAFTVLGLHNVMLIVYEFNMAAHHIYQKVGFCEIGRRRQSRLMKGKLWDTIYMDCLATDFSNS